MIDFNTLTDAINIAIQAAILIIGLRLGVIFIDWLIDERNARRVQLATLENRLQPFTQTLPGQIVHDGIGQLRTLVDQPSDPFIGNLLAIYEKALPERAERLTREELSAVATDVADTFIRLLDGIPHNVNPPAEPKPQQ